MPTYTYTGVVPRALFGLQEGVNAEVHQIDREAEPLTPRQTVVVSPGDTITTAEEYPHAELEPLADAAPAFAPAFTPATAPAPPVVPPAPAETPAEPPADDTATSAAAEPNL